MEGLDKGERPLCRPLFGLTQALSAVPVIVEFSIENSMWEDEVLRSKASAPGTFVEWKKASCGAQWHVRDAHRDGGDRRTAS